MASHVSVVLVRFTNGTQIDDSNYADLARKKMEKRGEDFPGLTTSKLRNVYAQIVNVYSRVNDAVAFENATSDLQYLKVKMAYAAGRDDAVKAFIDKTYLMAMLDRLETYDQFKLYCRYAESLVAYFKYYGGKD